MGLISRDFTGAPTLSDFIQDDAFVTGVEGPLGSGKSVACCNKLMRYACLQEPDAETNMRRSRWAVIRNTTPMLRSTTIKTWQECFSEHHCGPMNFQAPISHHIKRPPTQGYLDDDDKYIPATPGLDMEVLFLALDQDRDITKLQSLDLTGAWVNEACNVPEGIVDMLTGRVGRFPDVESASKSWHGIIMDTNAADDLNWWSSKMDRGEHVETVMVQDHEGNDVEIDITWKLYRQPPALLEVKPTHKAGLYKVAEIGFTHVELNDGSIVPWVVEEKYLLFSAGRWWYPNPYAENRKFLKAGYYAQQVANKALSWIQRYMQVKRVMHTEGKAWLPEYNDSEMSRALRVNDELPLLGGIDIGGGTLQPAAVVGQRGLLGDWRALAELSCFDMGLEVFTTELLAWLAREFPGREVTFYLDPAARTRDPLYKMAVEEHLRKKIRGHKFLIAPTNDPKIRRDAMAVPMGRLCNLGHTMVPGLVVDEQCQMLRAGLSGKWCRRKLQVPGEIYADEPQKNQWSHVCEAAGYMLLGGGEHSVLVNRKQASQAGQPMSQGSRRIGGTPVMKTDFDPRR